jgi:hypothetical protein
MDQQLALILKSFDSYLLQKIEPIMLELREIKSLLWQAPAPTSSHPVPIQVDAPVMEQAVPKEEGKKGNAPPVLCLPPPRFDAYAILSRLEFTPDLREIKFFTSALNVYSTLKHLRFEKFELELRAILAKFHKAMFEAIQTAAPDLTNLEVEEVYQKYSEMIINSPLSAETCGLTVCHTAEKGTHVEGSDTKQHKEDISRAGFRWRPLNGVRFWRVMSTPAQLPDPWRIFNMAHALHRSGIDVGIEIEDIPPESYSQERIVYLERRADAARERAEKAGAKAEAHYEASKRIGNLIPLGQPILVGHHSEKRHRRDLDRIHRNMTKSVEYTRKAESLDSNAEARQHAAKVLRAELEARESGETARQEAARIGFQELLRKNFKKVHPVIKSCLKGSEGKGSRYWALYTIRFHDGSMLPMQLWIQNNCKVSLSYLRAGSTELAFEIDDAEGPYEKLAEFFRALITKTHKPVMISNDHFHASFELDAFRICDKTDRYNEPATISTDRNGKRDLVKVFQWAQANRAKLEGMTFLQVNKAMEEDIGVRGHYYCRID